MLTSRFTDAAQMAIAIGNINEYNPSKRKCAENSVTVDNNFGDFQSGYCIPLQKCMSWVQRNLVFLIEEHNEQNTRCIRLFFLWKLHAYGECLQSFIVQ